MLPSMFPFQIPFSMFYFLASRFSFSIFSSFFFNFADNCNVQICFLAQFENLSCKSNVLMCFLCSTIVEFLETEKTVAYKNALDSHLLQLISKSGVSKWRFIAVYVLIKYIAFEFHLDYLVLDQLSWFLCFH